MSRPLSLVTYARIHQWRLTADCVSFIPESTCFHFKSLNFCWTADILSALLSLLYSTKEFTTAKRLVHPLLIWTVVAKPVLLFGHKRSTFIGFNYFSANAILNMETGENWLRRGTLESENEYTAWNVQRIARSSFTSTNFNNVTRSVSARFSFWPTRSLVIRSAKLRNHEFFARCALSLQRFLTTAPPVQPVFLDLRDQWLPLVFLNQPSLCLLGR